MARDHQPLPHNLDAERAILGAILEDNDALFDANKTLTSADFFEPFNANLYDLLRDKIEPGGRITALTALHDMSQNAIVGSDLTAKDVLDIIAREAAPREMVGTLAETVRELARRRLAIVRLEQAAKDLRSAPASVNAAEIRNKLDADITALYSGVEEFGLRMIPDVAEEIITEVGRRMNLDADEGLSTGLASVDSLIGTLMGGRLTVLAGNSGSGKSALAGQICEGVAEQGKVALMFQLEMDSEEVATRTLTAQTGIPGFKIERANTNDTELQRLFEANMGRRKMPYWVDDTGGLTAGQIEARMIRMKRLVGLDFVLIDHLQYVESADRKVDEVMMVGPNLRAFKRAAKKLRIPIMVLAQLKGSFSDGPVRRPKVADLWNSSAVEQNADNILFVHRPEYMLRRIEPAKDDKTRQDWEAQVVKWENLAELILGKRRGGKGWGTRTIGYLSDRYRFTDNPDDAHFPAPEAGILL